MSLENDLAARLRHMQKTALMWGSPEELECAALHLTHVWLRARSAAHPFAQTQALWQQLGGPFAGDAEEHAAMRERMWGQEEERARAQVVAGFTSVWASLARDEAREACIGPWLETLLDAPTLAGSPDRLNMALFALMGFVASEPLAYVEALRAERLRVGGHALRPLAVVSAPGPSDASLTYGRTFTTWGRVTKGLGKVTQLLAQPVG